MSADADPVVRVDGLRVSLIGSGRLIADDVSLHIGAGEVLGLVGESGSGKTTVGTAMLASLRKGAEITGGRVRVGDTDVLTLEPARLQAIRGPVISYVPQDPSTALNPALRIQTQLGELLEIHRRGLGGHERVRLVAEALEGVRLPSGPSFRRRYPHQLSGGQQQRVCLAMAFLLRPSAIVLDEPTTGLDVSTQAHILDVVGELCRAYSVAALYITHDLAVVAGLAARVAVMHDARIVETGACRQVLYAPSHPYTARLVAAVPDIDDHPQRDELAPPVESVSDTTRSADADAAVAAALERVEPGQDLAAVREISCGYDGRDVISGVTLALRRGECVALVGESGSGKSTLSRAMIGLLEPRRGSVELAGRSLAGSARDRPPAARRAMQYIFQNPYASLNPRQSIGQILAKAHRHFFGSDRGATISSVRAALERVALPASMERQYPDQLSGGERQRVAIARALVCDPHLLICDEVTSALDVSVQAQILDLLTELKREQGLGMLFVTHNLAVVRRLADRVAVLAGGHVVESGLTDDVLDAPQHEYTRTLLADTPSWNRARGTGTGGGPRESQTV